MRALVRRAEHQQPRAVAAHQRVHHRAPLVDRGAHHQAAHAVREQADRLLRLLHQAVEELAEPFGQHVERLTPVVRKTFDPVAAGEVLAQLAVKLREQVVGLDAGSTPLDFLEPAGGDVERVEPDPVLHAHLQVRTHHAGQHHHHRAVGAAGVAAGRGRECRHIVAWRGQGAKGLQPQRVGHRQPVAQRGARVDVGEVAEVRDVGAAVEQHARVGLRRHAGQHRRGVDHQVVVIVVEQQKVGQQHAQPFEQVAAFDVAGDDGHADAAAHRRVAQQSRHRRVGQHGLDARHQVRVGAVARDLEHDALERRVERAAEEEWHLPDQGQHARQEHVEVAAGQLGAVGRAGGTHVALHDDLAIAQRAGQRAQLVTLHSVRRFQLADDAPGLVGIGVTGALEGVGIAVDQGVEVAQAQQVGHQPTARMRHQADVGTAWQRLHQRDRVLDGAERQRGVLEGVDACAVVAFERHPQVAVAGAQVAEAADRAGRGAVHEHQHRTSLLRIVDRRLVELRRFEFGGRRASAAPVVQAGADRQAPLDRPHQRLGAEPADAELTGVATPFFQLVEGGVDDRVRCAAGDQRVDLADQPTGRLGQPASGRGALGAQPLEQHLAIRPQQLGMGEVQRGAQSLGAGDQDAAVGQLEHDHLAGCQRVLLLRDAVRRAARRGADVDGSRGLQVARRQELVLWMADRACRGGQQGGQAGAGGAPGELELDVGIGHEKSPGISIFMSAIGRRGAAPVLSAPGTGATEGRF